jgi:hypothetical protein
MDPISGNRLCYGHHFLSGMYGRLFQEDWGCSSTNFCGEKKLMVATWACPTVMCVILPWLYHEKNHNKKPYEKWFNNV